MPPFRASVVGPAAILKAFRFVVLALLLSALVFSLACGGSSSSATTTVTGPAPTFTSKPPTVSQEGVPYVYNITSTTTDGSTVTYAVTGTTGATISGSTLTWTPTHAQARISNTFTITATTSKKGTATQSFTLTPNGTINGTVVDHAVTTGGILDVKADLSATTVEILFPDNKGGYNVLRGSGDSSGNFTIPNVPPSSFWLHLPRTTNGITSDNYIWLSAADIDAGGLVEGRPDAVPEVAGVTIKPTVTLSAPAGSGDSIGWNSPDAPAIGDVLAGITNPFTTSFPQLLNLIDSTKGDRAYLIHYKPTTSGARAIVEDIEYKSITETDGSTVPITGTMSAIGGQTTDPVLKITQFDAIFAGLTNSAGTSRNFYVRDAVYDQSEGAAGGVDLIISNLNTTATDTDLGSISYGTVTPAGTAYFRFSDAGFRDYTVNGRGFSFGVGSDIVSNTIPVSTAPIVPILGEPVSPLINGKNFFTDQTILTSVPQISWSAPGLGTPTSYQLQIVNVSDPFTTQPQNWTFDTSASSVSVPAGLLQSGKTYVFTLTATATNVTTFATAPYRQGSQVAHTYESSGLITIGATASPKKAAATKATSMTRVTKGMDGQLHFERIK